MIGPQLLLKEIRRRELWPAFLARQKYSDDQPRDDQGRWTDTGGTTRTFVLRKQKIGEGTAYVIKVDGKQVGHLSGFEDVPDRGDFHLYKTELSDEALRGTGLFRTVVQQVANKYARGLWVYRWEASTALRKSLAKMSTYVVEKEKDRLRIQPTGVRVPQKYSEDQPRDNQGQWTSGFGGLMADIAKPDGGFTYSVTTNSSPKSGYALSIHKGREQVIPMKELTPLALTQYAIHNHDLLSQANNYLGAWHNPEDNKVYLDISTVVHSTEEATRLGRLHNQLAYFDLGKGEAIRLDTGKAYDEAITPPCRQCGHESADLRGPPGVVPVPDGHPADAGASGGSPALLRQPETPLKYSEDQPRDDIGRWTDTGAGGGRTSGRITSIKDAIERLGKGQGIQFERPDQVVTLLHKLRAVVKEAAERGQKAKVYDLCKVYVKGTNLFCEHNVHIPRDQMPQLKGIPRPGSLADAMRHEKNGKVDLTFAYLSELGKHGIGVEKTTVRADHLRAAQNQIDGAKVAKILHEYERDGIPDRAFYVSKDHYIVDGHHHYAAQVALQLAVGKSETIRMQVYRVNEKILPLLQRTKDYTVRMGIGAQAIGKMVKAFEPPVWLVAKAYPALVRLANQLEPHLREAFLKAIHAMRSAVDLERLAAAIQSNSLNAVQIEVQLAKFAERFGELAPVLKSGFHVGANVGLRQLAEEASIQLRFDVVNPAAVEHAQNHLAQIVRPFIDDAKEIIAEIVGDAVNGKYTYASAAREIRDTIGLDPRRYEALQNYEASLVELGVSGEALDGKLARYERTLLKSRSETIARTEIMRAATSGQREAWEEAARQGLIRRDEWNRVWKTTDDERLCDECGPMDEEWVAFNDEFEGGDPPKHPNCRCTIKLEQA
jgi:hypothetical protein